MGRGLARRSLYLFVWHPKRNWKSCVIAAIFAIVALAAGIAVNPLFGPIPETGLYSTDGHARISLAEALAYSICGRYGTTTGEDSIFHSSAIKSNEPYTSILKDQFGSIDKYCDAAHWYFTNNENSLFLLDSLFISIRPQGSLAWLANMHRAFRGLWLAVALFGTSLCGVGIIPLAFIAWAATSVVNLYGTSFLLSLYPTLAVLLLMSSVIVPALFFALRSRRMVFVILAGLGIGLLSAFIYNWRTSYGLIIVVQVIVGSIAYALWGKRKDCPVSFGSYAAAVACMLAGFMAFQAFFISPLVVRKTYNYPSHVVWHPIVLGLANPPNDFAKSQGIAWNDSVGLTIAHRIDPEATYLGPTYEHALRAYYFGLWEKYPGKMLAIYGNKIVDLAQWMPGLGRPVAQTIEKAIVPNGVVWFGWILAMAVGSLCVLPFNAPLSLFSLTLAAGVACASFEQVIVEPHFSLQYQGSLIIGFAALLAMMMASLATIFQHSLSKTKAPESQAA